MPERIPQSVAYDVFFKAFLASDHISQATGKTIAITISKNRAAFGNPSGGATNATEVANGWYYFAASTTDTGTLGGLLVHGAEGTIDNVDLAFTVVGAFNAGFTGIPAVIAGGSGGLPLSVDTSGRVDVLKVNGTSQTAGDICARLPAALTGGGNMKADALAINGVATTSVTTVSAYQGTTAANTAQTGDNYARLGAPAGASVSADVAAVKAVLPAALTANGNIKASLVEILTTALTETSGYLAAGFKAFFNVATPTLTVADVNQTGDSYNVVKSGGAGDAAAIKTQTDKIAFTVANKIDANTLYFGGTVQTTGKDVSSIVDSRLPAALTANGNIKASLVEILTTALTETSGYLAAAFKKFFNIATPASTMDALTLVATATNLIPGIELPSFIDRAISDYGWDGVG